MKILTASRLRELIHYNPETGIFTRIDPSHKMRRFFGREAGRLHKVHGYREIGVDGKLYRAHRLAWLYMTGAWPEDMVDHRDTDRSNNRWTNLRQADAVINGQNRRAAMGNSLLGVLGISTNGKGFRARIRFGNANHHLGTFPTVVLAESAYLAAKRQHHVI